MLKSLGMLSQHHIVVVENKGYFEGVIMVFRIKA